MDHQDLALPTTTGHDAVNIAQELVVIRLAMMEMLGNSRLQVTSMSLMQGDMMRMRDEMTILRTEVRTLRGKFDRAENGGRLNDVESDVEGIICIDDPNLKSSDGDGEKSPAKKTHGSMRTRKGQARQKSWEERIRDLVAFKERHGRTTVSKLEDSSLAGWIWNVRQARRHAGTRKTNGTKLTKGRIASLDAIGFDWHPINKARTGKMDDEIETEKESTEETLYIPSESTRKRKRGTKQTFAMRVEALKAFKEIHGHVDVSSTQDYSLFHFCSNCRFGRKHPEKAWLKITEDRIAALDALGFDWGLKTVSFSERLEQLTLYKERHGHLDMSVDDDPVLFSYSQSLRWSRRDKNGRRKPKLDKDRIAALDAIEFDWEPLDEDVAEDIEGKLDAEEAELKDDAERGKIKSFAMRVEDLKAFKELHGHLNVSSTQNRSLYNFCANYRYSRKHPERAKLKMTEDRIDALDAIGFDWGSKTVFFSERLEQLTLYKKRHGHLDMCRVDDPVLFDYSQRLRWSRKDKNGKSWPRLDKDRIAALDAIEFDWGPLDEDDVGDVAEEAEEKDDAEDIEELDDAEDFDLNDV